ncbi:MAG: hypothetical protein LBI33_01045 [Propionibacteriaceae bacterium]|nr:hypothetical protein [Propionibacteriaceae bacterium]
MGRFWRLAGLMVVGCVVAGCTPGGEADPEVSTPGVVASATPVVTPSASPTPTWSAEEQAAIDAVYKYAETWTRISQSMPNVDVNEIWQVAGGDTTNNDLAEWMKWEKAGVHLEGAPVLTLSDVAKGMTDANGTVYHVTGCQDISQSYISNASGEPATEKKRERYMVSFDVLHASRGQYLVIKDVALEELC